jgi:hypothetical protein
MALVAYRVNLLQLESGATLQVDCCSAVLLRYGIGTELDSGGERSLPSGSTSSPDAREWSVQ